MTSTSLKLAFLAAAVMTAAPVLAQPVDPAAQAQYNQQVQDYNAKQQAYDQSRTDYQARTGTYKVQQDIYAADRDAYARQRAAYDSQWGVGAWDRRGYSYDRYPGRDAARYYRGNPCERRASGDAVAGGAIGALAGAAIGSAVAGRGDHAEGAVLGALAGGAIGSSVSASNAARCDAHGYYFSYNQTVPYREASWYQGRDSGRYDYNGYRRMRCRLAPAPAYSDGYAEYRYVRVCPDASGRYRITG